MGKKLRYLWSFITPRRVPIGAGVSFDDSIEFKETPKQEQIEKAQRIGKAIYILKDPEKIGSFEMEGIIKRGDTIVYRLKHTLTGTVLTFPKDVFELLFINQNRK